MKLSIVSIFIKLYDDKLLSLEKNKIKFPKYCQLFFFVCLLILKFRASLKIKLMQFNAANLNTIHLIFLSLGILHGDITSELENQSNFESFL